MIFLRSSMVISNRQGRTQQTLTYGGRLAYAALLVFELLNGLGILHFELDFTWFGLALTSIIAWLVVEITGRILRTRYRCTHILPWFLAISVVVVYIDALGDILHFYSRFPWYDRVAHFAGGLVFATGFSLILRHLRATNIVKFGNALFSTFTIAMTALGAALYEIEEYLEDFFTGSNRLGNGFDTADDLMLGITGAVIVVIAHRIAPRLWRYRQSRRNTEEEVTITITTKKP